MDLFHRIFSFIKYKLNEVDAHSLQSPYLFDLYNSHISPAHYSPVFEEVERQRETLINESRRIQREDLGAGKRKNMPEQSLKTIIKRSTLKPKYARLLCQLSRSMKAKNILELGTSVGITTLYLAKSNQEAEIFTFEGDPSLVEIDIKLFSELNNITLIPGDINNTLPDFMSSNKSIDFAFIDANHTYEATLFYYQLVKERMSEYSAIVFDDIYWSKDMTKAWQSIKINEKENLILDIYKMGIILKGKDLPAGYYFINF